MSDKKGSGFLKAFRYGVKFSERAVKNIISQIKWIWKTNKNWLTNLRTWRTSNGYHPSVEYSLGTVIIIFSILFLLPFLSFWALIKSI
jgi:hypothetical protein